MADRESMVTNWSRVKEDLGKEPKYCLTIGPVDGLLMRSLSLLMISTATQPAMKSVKLIKALVDSIVPPAVSSPFTSRQTT